MHLRPLFCSRPLVTREHREGLRAHRAALRGGGVPREPYRFSCIMTNGGHLLARADRGRRKPVSRERGNA
jgi:hypothetical protein